MLGRILSITVAGLALSAAPASASELNLYDFDFYGQPNAEVTYTGGHLEANRVTVTFDSATRQLVVRDPGRTITPTGSAPGLCTISVGQAVCHITRHVTQVTALLGENADTFASVLDPAEGLYLGVFGGQGKDVLHGDAGATISGLYGDQDADRLLGGAGYDVLQGDLGDDDISGGAGQDEVRYDTDTAPFGIHVTLDGVADDGIKTPLGGSVEKDNVRPDVEDLYGTQAADVLIGSSAANRISGNSGNDEIRGGAGDDSLTGDDGADTVTGGAGSDRMYGEAGSDVIYARDGEVDMVDCYQGGVQVQADPFDNAQPQCLFLP